MDQISALTSRRAGRSFRAVPESSGEAWPVKKRSASSVKEAIGLAQDTTAKRRDVRKAMPSHIKPMLALLSKMPSDTEQYAFEYKWDGIRAVCYWDGKQMKLESRNELDITYRWPELTKLGEALGPTAVILDGEIVALDSKNQVSFRLLAQRMHLSSRPSAAQMRAVPIVYMIFDILYLDDRVLMPISYGDRRAVLGALKLAGENWQTPPFHTENSEAMLKAAVENGLEGLVAKKLDSAYLPGHRTSDWLKIKLVNRQEFVIGGWNPVQSSANRGVGALLVGYYDRSKKLVFAGKVGTGFTDRIRKELEEQFEAIAGDTSPFGTTVQHKNVKFVEPRMVAEIEFREWTRDGRLRHPSFKGLREDKEPKQVARETPSEPTRSKHQ